MPSKRSVSTESCAGRARRFWAICRAFLTRAGHPACQDGGSRSQEKSMKLHRLTLGGLVALSLVAAGCTTTASTSTASRGDPVLGSSSLSPETMRQVDEGYRATLNRLYDTTP